MIYLVFFLELVVNGRSFKINGTVFKNYLNLWLLLLFKMQHLSFTETELPKALEEVHGSRERREFLISNLIKNPGSCKVLLNFCFERSSFSGKACQVLESVCLRDLDYLLPEIATFVSRLEHLSKDPEIRPMAKICECLMTQYYMETSSKIHEHLTAAHREKIAEVCFHWLLSDQKTAPQAHAMSCLYGLGSEFSWIHPELQTILEQNYVSGSSGYKARARMILKKMGQ